MKYKMAEALHLTAYHPECQKLVWMPPERFLRMVPPVHFFDKGSLDFIIDKLKKGESLEPLWVDVDPYTGEVTNHEGRHRAASSWILGIEEIPVIIFYRHNYDRIPLKKAEKFRIPIREHVIPADENIQILERKLKELEEMR